MNDRRFKLYDKSNPEDDLQSQPFEINFRHELRSMLDENKRSKWHIYRRKDLTKHTEGFIEFANENPNGPDFEYTDELHRGFKIPQNTLSLIKRVNPSLTVGEPFQPFTFFVFKYKSEYHGKVYIFNPKSEDVIYEINYHDDMAPQIVDNVFYTGKAGSIAPPFAVAYNIHNIVKYDLDDNGRVEFYLLACIGNPISNK
jgi:hypothetical protein